MTQKLVPEQIITEARRAVINDAKLSTKQAEKITKILDHAIASIQVVK